MTTTRKTGTKGFTLLELLVSITILAVLTTLLFAAFNQASKAWLQSENRVETFQGARAALDFMGKELSQALCNSNVQFLANVNSLAFVAPVGGPADGADLVKIVYRLNYIQGSGATDDGTGVGGNNAPPQKLLRRISTFASNPTNCWDYGHGQPCSANYGANYSPWNFYNGGVNWPETSDKSKTEVLAENIVSLAFLFTMTNDTSILPVAYWISTNTSGSVWNNEILGGQNGQQGIISQAGQDALLMTNHAPIGVQITIGAIDSRAASRLQSIRDSIGPTAWQLYATGPNSLATLHPAQYAVYTNIINSSVHYFSTYVSIPSH